MALPEPTRGDVWFADVQGDNKRPVLVLTREPMTRHLHSVICAPITSVIRHLSTEVAVSTEAGLAHDSVANFDNMFLLPRSRLLRRLGRIDDATLPLVCIAAARAVGCR
jgi:mRNA-degrading endonuclease toxin of MazEF toxin-antitoxin module